MKRLIALFAVSLALGLSARAADAKATPGVPDTNAELAAMLAEDGPGVKVDAGELARYRLLWKLQADAETTRKHAERFILDAGKSFGGIPAAEEAAGKSSGKFVLACALDASGWTAGLTDSNACWVAFCTVLTVHNWSVEKLVAQSPSELNRKLASLAKGTSRKLYTRFEIEEALRRKGY